jgi:cobalamin biosynthesis Mg chelatase CobN
MAPVNRIDALSASPSAPPHHDPVDGTDDLFAFTDFEEELKRLSAANQQILEEFQHQDDDPCSAVADRTPSTNTEELAHVRTENAELRARVQELEALGSGQDEEVWLERQREYETLLEEKSEVIRLLHQRIQEVQESAIGGGSAPVGSVTTSGTKLGQAEEILRLKREIEGQRRQLDQDEQEMMGQMRQMEIAMARERAQMARQRQEVQRLQADLAREIENSSRDPELRERLQTLRRAQEPKPALAPNTAAPKADQQSSGFFRRMFG